MARTSIKIIGLLRDTADRLQHGAPYQWGHMGSCNCGHLAQTITKYSKGAIHEAAMTRHGDWAEQLREYCPQSGLPLDAVIDKMLETGFTREDLSHLERLSDQHILNYLPPNAGFLKHNVRDDVVLYLHTWADLLEKQLLESISLHKLQKEAVLNKIAILDA
ncbi:hypothetical protein ABID22_001558 [Pontibacter aydingkolensis]|uniref:Uncharacterized protein n=1 Tax=Pontibacter aydingkolensis TaxID=1911536 RepID=A0ABS7CUR8_9BACT|nr:hypothetical protein [Pontibacter aydingkolensis]MBW7467232.1 hypothetical protein [Pontibacter aydingkolensis]